MEETQIPELAEGSHYPPTQRPRGEAQKQFKLRNLKSRPSVEGLIVEELLGQGGFGQVWKAKIADSEYSLDHTSERETALKVILKCNIKAMKNEVKLWRMLSNKALASALCSGHDIPIVQMYGLHITQNGLPAISMQLCKGGSLAQLLKNIGSPLASGKQEHCLAEKDAAMVAFRIAEALSFCHQNRVLHLDVKPDNVLIMSDYNSDCDLMQNMLSTCFLADFGLSQMLPDVKSTGELKEFGEGPHMMKDGFCGTPGYMAPEVITDGLYSPAADAWSLGALLLQTLTGRLPPHCLEDPADLIYEFEEWKSGYTGDWVDNYMTAMGVEAWWNITHTARNAIRRLLSPHPRFRMTVIELLRHPWIRENAPLELTKAQHYYDVPANCASSAIDVNVPAAGLLNAPIIPTVH